MIIKSLIKKLYNKTLQVAVRISKIEINRYSVTRLELQVMSTDIKKAHYIQCNELSYNT